MDPQSLDLQGFPEARLEMKVAPFRALTQFAILLSNSVLSSRNEGRLFQGIDTIVAGLISFIQRSVEMKVAPFRALTHSSCFSA